MRRVIVMSLWLKIHVIGLHFAGLSSHMRSLCLQGFWILFASIFSSSHRWLCPSILLTLMFFNYNEGFYGSSSRIGIVLSAFCREIFREQAMALAMIAGFDSRFLRFVGSRKGFFNFFYRQQNSYTFECCCWKWSRCEVGDQCLQCVLFVTCFSSKSCYQN